MLFFSSSFHSPLSLKCLQQFSLLTCQLLLLDADNNPTVNPVEPPKLNPDEVQGGYGSGEVLFGSDDNIFDIEEGIVKYGEVISKYYGDIVGKFNDGTLPEEYKEFFDKYYDLLFGFEDETETGEN